MRNVAHVDIITIDPLLAGAAGRGAGGGAGFWVTTAVAIVVVVVGPSGKPEVFGMGRGDAALIAHSLHQVHLAAQ
eukprot:COSAG01_NODE_22441_length_855_cov_1.935185_1_plen_74_part_10